LYADDINILVVDKEKETFQHKITFVMQQLELWFSKNDLIVNIDKTRAISLHSHQNRYPSGPHIIFNNDFITYSSELQFLLLFIMENSAWHVHTHSLFAGLSKIYSMIKALTWERWRLLIIFMRWRGGFHDPMEKKPFLSTYE